MFEGQRPRHQSYYDGKDYHPFRYWIDGPNGLSNDGHVHSEPGISNWHSFTRFVDLYDFQNRKGADGMRPVSPCSHLKIAHTGVNSMPNHVKCQGGYQYQMFPSDFVLPYLTPQIVKDFLPTVPEAEIYANGIKAFDKFNDQIPQGVSFINFLYELREYKNMVPKFAKNLRNAPRAANNNFLSFEFGWKPLIGDLAKMSTLYQSIIHRLDYLRKTRRKVVPVRFRELGFYDNPAIGSYTPWWVANNWSSGGEEFFRAKLIAHDVDFFASCKLYHDLRGLDDAWAYFRALTASLGINNPLKIVWNAVPFSFILDWFIPVGDWLGRAAVQPFQGEWRFWDTTHSVKQTLSYDISHHYSGGPCGVGNKDDFMSRLDIVMYRRALGLPVLSADLLGLDDDKQALLASLAYNFTEHKQRPHKGAKRK